MTALAADKQIVTKDRGDQIQYPVAATTHIYKGALVCVNSSGYLVAATDAASVTFVGIAHEARDNDPGSNGDLFCRVRSGVVARLTATGVAQSSVGQTAYVLDDATVALGSGVTNTVAVGVIVAYESSTAVWVHIPHPSAAAAGAGGGVFDAIVGGDTSLGIVGQPAASATAAGGVVAIAGAAGGSTSGAGGAVSKTGGSSTSGAGGAASQVGGAGGTAGAGGASSVTGGLGGATGAGGAASVTGGAGGSTSGAGGAVAIAGGAGTAGDGNGGAITINGGAPNGSGTRGTITFHSAVATPSGGLAGIGIMFGTTAGYGIYYGTGTPTHSAAQGSIYMNAAGSSTSTRLYICSGTTNWVAVTTAS